MILKCEFDYYYGCYCCSIGNKTLTTESTHVEINGVHEDGKTNNDFLKLRFFKCKIPKIPHFIGNPFINITTIDLNRSGLKSITKFDLQQFPKLEIIFAPENSIEFLPGDLFEFTPNVEDINFYNNNIKYIGEKLLDGLKNLKKVYLHCNVNIDCIFTCFYVLPDYDGEVTLEEMKRRIRDDCQLNLKMMTGNLLAKMIEYDEGDLEKLFELNFYGNFCNHEKLRDKAFERIQKKFNGKLKNSIAKNPVELKKIIEIKLQIEGMQKQLKDLMMSSKYEEIANCNKNCLN